MATTTGLDATALDSLRLRMRGRVIEPHEDGYEEARLAWNALYDRRPEAVARCTGAADVMAAVGFAREEGVPLSVKGGGHDYAGNSRGDGGLLVDLSPMGAVEVDPDRRIARAQGGAKWGSLDHEAQAFGLAVPGPTVSSIGVGGAALGGGTGYLHRKHGLALDNVVSADVVTAAGDRVRASGDENRDLFWALRGGGGNFGIVTSFEFRLHEVGPEILAGQIFHPYDDAAAVIRFARDFLADAPDALQCYSFILEVPEVEGFPAEQQGRTALALIVSYAGPVDEGEEALRPLRDFGDPFLDAVQPQLFTALQRSFDAGMPPGYRWYSRAHYLQELSDGLIDLVVERAEPLPGDFTVVYFEPLGGAVSRVDPSETAFPHRGSPCGIHILPGWTDPDRDDELMDWARSFHQAVEPYSTGGVYVNLLSHDQEDGVRSAYGENLGRLGELKAKWDPENLFRVNHNIQPGG